MYLAVQLAAMTDLARHNYSIFRVIVTVCVCMNIITVVHASIIIFMILTQILPLTRAAVNYDISQL